MVYHSGIYMVEIDWKHILIKENYQLKTQNKSQLTCKVFSTQSAFNLLDDKIKCILFIDTYSKVAW